MQQETMILHPPALYAHFHSYGYAFVHKVASSETNQVTPVRIWRAEGNRNGGRAISDSGGRVIGWFFT